MANGNGKKKTKRRLVWASSIAVILIVIGAAVTRAASNGTKIDPTKIASVDQGDIAKSVIATGKIEPITKVEVKSKASGIVQKLFVDAGDHVKQGQVLAELDKEELQAQVRGDQAQLTAAEANLRAAQADVERSKVDAEGVDVPTLQRAYDRAKTMAADGVVSASAQDDAQRNYELAVNKRDLARAQLTINQAKVKQAQAQVTQYQAALARSEEQLNYATVESPINGEVLSRDVEVGDAVSSILVLGSSATLVMTLGDMKQVYVDGKVDESDIGKVYLGQPARIKVESFKDKSFNGKVTKIAPMGVEKDNVTTFQVRVSIDNSGGELKALMTANAEIILDEHKNVLMIPESALIYDKDKKTFVEVPDLKAKDGKRRVAVNVGISNGAKTELLSGLRKDDKVILQ
ncbi:MAG TPA: efflux RND transporter periplasmic adaptor subunit [Terriglobales bacterium]|nr:efflux RND transporter periplasmic adaptor subunit [Terriglobales bacterium]